MADPTNPNDPKYKNDPHYVYVGGRWQYRSAPGDANYVDPNAPAAGGHVQGQTVWTDPFPAPKRGAQQVRDMTGGIDNFANYQQLARQFREGAIRGQATNPYNAGIADQSRPAQLALINQMRGQMNGPSLAAMQGQRALGQSGQQALGMAAGNPAAARAAMMGAQGAGAGLAGDVGQARLGEVMRSQAGMGGVAGNLRGGDLRSAEAQSQSGLRAQEIADKNSMFYSQLGSTLDQARARQALEQFKLGQRIDVRQTERDLALLNDLLGIGGTAVSTAFSMGNKGGK